MLLGWGSSQCITQVLYRHSCYITLQHDWNWKCFSSLTHSVSCFCIPQRFFTSWSCLVTCVSLPYLLHLCPVNKEHLLIIKTIFCVVASMLNCELRGLHPRLGRNLTFWALCFTCNPPCLPISSAIMSALIVWSGIEAATCPLKLRLRKYIYTFVG